MDAELRELERLFQAAQEVKTTTRLSERSVVELVVKLQQLELLDCDLLHTVSGKEYVTQECLQREMEAEIDRLRRVSLIDLASSSGVDLYHCEKQADLIVAASSELMLVQGEIITSSYWDSLAEEVNETLKEASQVSLGELARRYNLGSELLTGMLSSRIGTIVHGKMEGGQLYTPEYVARVKAAVRGAVRALTIPTSLQSVWSSLQSQLRNDGDGSTTAAEGGLFHMILNELVAEGAVKGSLRGGGANWTPAVFAQSQRETVEAFFSQNAFISYDALKKLQILQPKQYLETKYPNGIALDTVFIHTSSLELVDSAAEEALAGGGWFDALDAVPPAFSSSDSTKVLRLCPSVQHAIKESTAIFLSETCVVSNVFTKNLLEKLQGWVKEVSTAPVIVSRSSAEEHQEADTKPASAKTRRNEKKAKGDSNDALNDDYDNGKSGKNKRKGGKNKGTKKDAAPVPSKVASDEQGVPSAEKLAEKTVEWFPDIQTAGTENGYTGVLAMSLASHFRPQIIAHVASLRQVSFMAKAEDRRKRLEALQMKVNEGYGHLQLFTKALDIFQDDKALEAILQRHLLRTTGAEIADVLLEAQVTEQRNSEDHEALPTGPFTPATRIALARKLPGSSSSVAVELIESLEGKSVSEFDSALEAVARESGLRLKRLDRKSEKALFHSYRKNLSEEISQEVDPIALLPKVVALLYAQVHGRALQAPGRVMSSAVVRLKDSIQSELYTVLENYHSATVSLLALLSTTNPPANIEDCVRNKRELLEARMQELKDITSSSAGPAAAGEAAAIAAAAPAVAPAAATAAAAYSK